MGLNKKSGSYHSIYVQIHHILKPLKLKCITQKFYDIFLIQEVSKCKKVLIKYVFNTRVSRMSNCSYFEPVEAVVIFSNNPNFLFIRGPKYFRRRFSILISRCTKSSIFYSRNLISTSRKISMGLHKMQKVKTNNYLYFELSSKVDLPLGIQS